MRHMVEASQVIQEYTDRGRKEFDGDRSVRDAIVYQVIVLGEAAKAVIAADPTLENDLPEIEWSLIARMRDRPTSTSVSCRRPRDLPRRDQSVKAGQLHSELPRFARGDGLPAVAAGGIYGSLGTPIARPIAEAP